MHSPIRQTSRSETILSTEAIQFAERALIDFGLMEAYRMRPAGERDECMAWLTEAATQREEEERVSTILDALWFAAPLPVAGASRAHRSQAAATACTVFDSTQP